MTTEASVATTWKHPDKVRPAALPGAGKFGARIDLQRPRLLAAPPAGSDLKAVPGNKGLPGVGSTFSFMFSGPDFTRRMYDRYGPVTWIRSLGLDLCMALGPDATQSVLVNADKAYSQSGWEWFIGPFFKRGLMLLDFDEHLLHRRIMQEAFTRPRLTGYLERTDELVSKDVAGWPSEGQMFAYPTLKRLSLDIATHIFMGDSTGEDDAKLQTAFIDTVRAGTSVIRADVKGLRWHKGLVGRQVLEDYFRSKLPAKRATETDDLFSALCHVETDTGQTFSDDDVVNHMIFLMMAAHDTSTITTSAVFAALAANPEWQEKAREQSMALDELTIDALDELTVLDLVIKEALRLTAPVPSMVRKTVKDTELLGHYVPEGTFVSVSPWFTHYMHEVWTNPETFDPERFAEPRNEDKAHRYAWVPFGGGAHKCIGMYFGTQEVKILVHHMLRRYRWTTPPGYVVPWDLLSLPMPADGLPLELHPIR